MEQYESIVNEQWIEDDPALKPQKQTAHIKFTPFVKDEISLALGGMKKGFYDNKAISNQMKLFQQVFERENRLPEVIAEKFPKFAKNSFLEDRGQSTGDINRPFALERGERRYKTRENRNRAKIRLYQYVLNCRFDNDSFIVYAVENSHILYCYSPANAWGIIREDMFKKGRNPSITQIIDEDRQRVFEMAMFVIHGHYYRVLDVVNSAMDKDVEIKCPSCGKSSFKSWRSGVVLKRGCYCHRKEPKQKFNWQGSKNIASLKIFEKHSRC